MEAYLKIVKNGLWTNNQALVALLGLCPLLAVTRKLYEEKNREGKNQSEKDQKKKNSRRMTR